MLTVYQSNRLIGNVIYGYVRFYDDAKPLGSFHVYDESGQADDRETAIEAFFKASEPITRMGYEGKPIKVVSEFSDYGYAILAGAPWPEGDEENVSDR